MYWFTNGDIYILYDRLKGLSWDSNLLGEFRLTALQDEDLALVERLRPQQLANPDIAEAFRHLAESFTTVGSDFVEMDQQTAISTQSWPLRFNWISTECRQYFEVSASYLP
jgi:hypothetical protein